MNDNYLWDGSGEPDPEIQKLESLLNKFRHNRPAPEFPLPAGILGRLRAWVGRARRAVRAATSLSAPIGPRFAMLAGLALVLSVVWLALRRPTLHPDRLQGNAADGRRAAPPPSKPSWQVASLSGAPRVGTRRVQHSDRLGVGEWLETDGSSKATIDVSTIGQVQVEPNTLIRLVDTQPNEHRLALKRGTIHAVIWAPPGRFFVETPSAVAVDLGCRYTLKVDEKGAGLVEVTFGWVGFEFDGRESFIPAGAVCATRPGTGPGTPYFQDAPKAFRAALELLDSQKSTPEARTAALNAVLIKARRRDAFTLWHLLARADPTARAQVYERLAALVPPPQEVTREQLLRGDKRALDLWWNQLGLGDTSWWRIWERPWTPQAK